MKDRHIGELQGEIRKKEECITRKDREVATRLQHTQVAIVFYYYVTHTNVKCMVIIEDAVR